MTLDDEIRADTEHWLLAEDGRLFGTRVCNLVKNATAKSCPTWGDLFTLGPELFKQQRGVGRKMLDVLAEVFMIRFGLKWKDEHFYWQRRRRGWKRPDVLLPNELGRHI